MVCRGPVQGSDLGRLRKRQGILGIHTEVPHRALKRKRGDEARLPARWLDVVGLNRAGFAGGCLV